MDNFETDLEKPQNIRVCMRECGRHPRFSVPVPKNPLDP